jgi:flagellar biosynthetic protein FliR
MDIFNFDAAIFLGFLLTFMRVSLVVFMLPIFNTEGLPGLWKASMCLIITMALWPRVALPASAIPAHPFGIMVLIFGEMLIGLALGLATRFFFAGIQMGGDILAFQMGFTMINFADPSTGANTGLVSYFLNMTATLVFLTLDGHLYLLKAFADTFYVVPAGAFAMTDSLMTHIFNLASMMFVFAVKVAAPVLAALFMVEMAMALMTRSAPQIQIMQFGFPIKIVVGFFFLGILFVIIGQESRNFVVGLEGLFANILHAMLPAGVK